MVDYQIQQKNLVDGILAKDGKSKETRDPIEKLESKSWNPSVGR